MPRQRREQNKQILTSTEVGSDSLEPTSIELAQPGKYPEDYEDHPDEWKAAFDHCAGRNNTEKACILYADAHEADYAGQEEEE